MGVTKYQANGSNYYRADFYVIKTNGKRERITKRKFMTRAMAEQYIRHVKHEADEGRYFGRRSLKPYTIAELWKKYSPVAERDKKSYKSDEGRAVYILDHLGDIHARDITQRDIEAYRTKRLSENTRFKKPPAYSTLNRELEQIKRMLNWAVECEYIQSNPIAHVKRLPENNVRDVVVTEEQFKELCEHADDHLRPILVTAYDTGMRLGEILALKWPQVNLRQKRIQLGQKDTKTKEPRTIVLTDRVKEALDDLPRSIRKDDYVFINNRTGEPYSDIRKPFLKAREAAKLKQVRFHDLRRSFVTNARKRGVPESVVMRMSGHRTRSVFDRYNIISEEDLREAVGKIEQGRESELKEAEEDSAENEKMDQKRLKN